MALDDVRQLNAIQGRARPLRVLCISHSAVGTTYGRLRYRPLLDRPDLSLEVVMPNRWFENGRWLAPDPIGGDEEWLHALPIRWANAGPATWHLHHYVGLETRIRRTRPNVIHLWQEPWSLVTLQALRLRNQLFPRAAFVLEVDQNILKRLPPPFEQIRRNVLRQTNFVLGRSDDAIKVVRACGYDGPSDLISYGVDQRVFRPPAPHRRRSGAPLSVGYAGRLVEGKGIGDLIDAAGRTSRPVTVSVMGEGPFSRALLAQAAAAGLANRFRLLSWQPPAEVARFMGNLDVFALLTRRSSSMREQFGRVIIEAQACGTPVIGSDCGAIPNVVGGGGWIVPERSPHAVATLLDQLGCQPLELERARGRALCQVGERFSLPIVAAKLMGTWSAAAASAGRSGR